MNAIKTTITITKVAKSEKNPNLTIVSMVDDAGRKMYQRNWGSSDLTRAEEKDRFIVQGKLEKEYFTGNDGTKKSADWFSGQAVCKLPRRR